MEQIDSDQNSHTLWCGLLIMDVQTNILPSLSHRLLQSCELELSTFHHAVNKQFQGVSFRKPLPLAHPLPCLLASLGVHIPITEASVSLRVSGDQLHNHWKKQQSHHSFLPHLFPQPCSLSQLYLCWNIWPVP